MNNYSYDFSMNNDRWGHTDILDTDLEQQEYDKNFDYKHDVYNSILDDEPTYNRLMNFHEDDQDALYAYEEEDGAVENSNSDDEDNDLNDRNSYRDRNMDDTYYLI